MADHEAEEDSEREQVEERWRVIRGRLEDLLGARSNLAPPLAAYAIEHEGALDPDEVVSICEEYGAATDPPAAQLFPLLPFDMDGSAARKMT